MCNREILCQLIWLHTYQNKINTFIVKKKQRTVSKVDLFERTLLLLRQIPELKAGFTLHDTTRLHRTLYAAYLSHFDLYLILNV